MNRILFIALIISQILISAQGIFLAVEKNSIAGDEQELKLEHNDEPELLIRTRNSSVTVNCAGAPALFFTNKKNHRISVPVALKGEGSTLPLFIKHRSLRV